MSSILSRLSAFNDGSVWALYVDSYGARQSKPGNGQHRATTSVISYRNLGRIKLANSVKPANTNITLYLKLKRLTTKIAATYGKQYQNIHALLCPITHWAQKISLNYSKTLHRVALLNISIMTTKNCAFDFLNRYDKREVSWQENRCLKLQIINDNFTESEISDTIDSFKNSKSPGIDLIPAEFIKSMQAGARTTNNGCTELYHQ